MLDVQVSTVLPGAGPPMGVIFRYGPLGKSFVYKIFLPGTSDVCPNKVGRMLGIMLPQLGWELQAAIY